MPNAAWYSNKELTNMPFDARGIYRKPLAGKTSANMNWKNITTGAQSLKQRALAMLEPPVKNAAEEDAENVSRPGSPHAEISNSENANPSVQGGARKSRKSRKSSKSRKSRKSSKSRKSRKSSKSRKSRKSRR